jgi:hypothetical protein
MTSTSDDLSTLVSSVSSFIDDTATQASSSSSIVSETLTTAIATTDRCLISGSTAEYYDCCTDISEKMCTIMGSIDFGFAGILFLIFLIVLCRSEWLRRQSLIIAAFVF